MDHSPIRHRRLVTSIALWIGASLIARTWSPVRSPAFAAGESGETCQATTPDCPSIQDTPSSGAVNIDRCWKLMTPKTMAARVARARTAAPNRTRRLSLIGALTGYPCKVAFETAPCNPASKLYKLSTINNHMKINRLQADRTREGDKTSCPPIYGRRFPVFNKSCQTKTGNLPRPGMTANSDTTSFVNPAQPLSHILAPKDC